MSSVGQSGICIATHENETELWSFVTSNDEGTNSSNFFKYSIDENTLEPTFVKTCTHDLGHVNSASYCKETDALICGNGSGSYTLPGAIYIVENAFAKETLNRSDAITIDVGMSFGDKVNCVWGESNFGNYDIAEEIFISLFECFWSYTLDCFAFDLRYNSEFVLLVE